METLTITQGATLVFSFVGGIAFVSFTADKIKNFVASLFRKAS